MKRVGKRGRDGPKIGPLTHPPTFAVSPPGTGSWVLAHPRNVPDAVGCLGRGGDAGAPGGEPAGAGGCPAGLAGPGDKNREDRQAEMSAPHGALVDPGGSLSGDLMFWSSV
jgi:hypothetical protein